MARGRFLSLGIILVGVALSGTVDRFSGSVEAQDAPPIVPVNLMGSFAVPTTSILKVHQIASSNGSLWFISHGSGVVQAIRTDSAGLLRGIFSLGPINSTQIDHICVSEDDRLGVLHPDGQLDVFTASGELTETLAGGQRATGCAFVDKPVFIAKDDVIIPLDGVNAGSIVGVPGRPLLWPTLVLAMRGQLEIIEAGEATLNILTPETGLWKKLQLLAPEIQGVNRPARDAKQVMPSVAAAAVDALSGDVFVLASPFYASAPIILKFNSQGTLIARIRCLVPHSAALITDTNRAGRFSVSNVAVLDRKLLLISASQKIVNYFGLD